MSSIIGEAFVRVRPLTTGFQESAQGDVQKAGTHLGKVFATAFAAAGFAVGVKSVVEAAVEHQAAFAVLEKTVTNAGAQNELYGQSIENLLEKEARLKGFSDEQLASSFQRLVSVTHDSDKAFKDLGEAEDLARFRHIGVEQAALALAKAEQGNATALQRYGIVVPKVSSAADALRAKYVQLQQEGVKLDPVQKAQYETALSLAEATDKQATAQAGLALVNSRVGGSAATFASTAAGKLAIAQQNFHQFEVQLGDKVLPLLIEVGNHLETIGRIAEGVGAYLLATRATTFFESIGSSAVTASGEVGILKKSLIGLGELSPIGVAIALSLVPGNSTGKELLDQSGGLGHFLAHAPVIGGFDQQIAGLAGKLLGKSPGEFAGQPQLSPEAAKSFLQGEANQALQQIAGTGPIAKQRERVLKSFEGSGYSAAKAKELTDNYFGTIASTAATSATKHVAKVKPELNTAGKALVQSLTDGVKSDQTDLADLKTQMADAVTQGVQAVNDAVNQAKQNLNTIGGGLSSAINEIFTKPITDAQAKLTAAQNRLGLHAAETTLKTLGEEILLPGGKRLSRDPAKALAQLQALQKTKHGSPGLEAFIQQYQQAALGVDSAHLAIRQQTADQRAQSVTRRIADLTDEFNKGQITAKQLNTAITRELVKDGATYKRAGHLLGVAFADGFQGDLEALAKQTAALVGGPQRPGSGLAPSIVRPIETLNQVTKQEAAIAKQQRDKQLDETKKQTQLLTKIHARQEASKFSSSLDHNPGTQSKKTKDLAGLGGG